MPFTKNDPNINREGRPTGSLSVVVALKKKLQEIDPSERKRNLDIMLDEIMKAVKAGDVAMIKDIIDRVDGKPQQNTDITTKGESINTMSYDRAKTIITEGGNKSDSTE